MTFYSFQRQPVLAKGGGITSLKLRWHKLNAAVRQSLSENWFAFCATFLLPSRSLYHTRGQLAYNSLLLKKKGLLLTTFVFLLMVMQLQDCLNHRPLMLLPKRSSSSSSPSAKYSILAPPTPSANTSNINGPGLASPTSRFFAIFDLLSEATLETISDYTFKLDILVMLSVFALWFILSVVSFLRLLNEYHFILNNSSVFKRIFSTLFMTSQSYELGYQFRLNEYLAIKESMSHNWGKWTWPSFCYDCALNVLIALPMTAFFYVFSVSSSFSSSDGVHTYLLKHSFGGDNTVYYVSMGAVYFVIRYLSPVFFVYLGSLFHRQKDCLMNLFTVRIVVLIIAFYSFLVFSLMSDYPLDWAMHLQRHFCIHILVDFAVLLTRILCMPVKFLSCSSKTLSRKTLGYDHFNNVIQFGVDMFIFGCSAVLLHSAVPLIIVKQIFAYIYALLTANRRNVSNHEYYSIQNLKFLESLLSVIFVGMALLIQCLTLEEVIRQCFREHVASLLSYADVFDFPGTFGVAGTTMFLYGVLLLLACLQVKGRVHHLCSQKELNYFRVHLQETNSDKEYQILKKKQWFPECKCRKCGSSNGNNRK